MYIFNSLFNLNFKNFENAKMFFEIFKNLSQLNKKDDIKHDIDYIFHNTISSIGLLLLF